MFGYLASLRINIQNQFINENAIHCRCCLNRCNGLSWKIHEKNEIFTSFVLFTSNVLLFKYKMSKNTENTNWKTKMNRHTEWATVLQFPMYYNYFISNTISKSFHCNPECICIILEMFDRITCTKETAPNEVEYEQHWTQTKTRKISLWAVLHVNRRIHFWLVFSSNKICTYVCLVVDIKKNLIIVDSI